MATYDTRGKHIYTGNSRGKILIFHNSKGFKTVSEFKVQGTGTTAVKGIEFSRRGGSFLVNTADRVIRVYKTKDVLQLADGKYVKITSVSTGVIENRLRLIVKEQSEINKQNRCHNFLFFVENL